ncbi:recombinase family protein [Lentilactobacillus buchneri]|uniref:recombinase family protein n=1 Tax=Lentilactobacillus buchneri TaxID=1581 RepID=UPI0012924B90|nr:recombinase family protein [Lentilactobacillus buchneri]MQM61685.1 hypothetical protein [Lentilactobacillus buchneri]MQM79179.1 hypothetical protein [Lentilactobacillus buchneri]
MRVGYAQVSSADQNLARQVTQLHQAKVDKIFQEKVSGKTDEELEAYLPWAKAVQQSCAA